MVPLTFTIAFKSEEVQSLFAFHYNWSVCLCGYFSLSVYPVSLAKKEIIFSSRSSFPRVYSATEETL
jgi:hypothetical protein